MKQIKHQLRYNSLAEKKYFDKKEDGFLKLRLDPLTDSLHKKIPPDLKGILEKVFEKAFHFLFEKGTGLIEKTFDKEDIEINHLANDFVFEMSGTRSSARKLHKLAGKNIRFGKLAGFVEGSVLGILGIGIPDIPVFISLILRGLYEIALSYGFDYLQYQEKIYILKLIQTAFAEENREELNQDLDQYGRSIDSGDWAGSLESEIKKTSKSLSDAMLIAKFVQGLPIIGASGAFFNYSAYKRVAKLATIKYNKRYLEKKLAIQKELN